MPVIHGHFLHWVVVQNGLYGIQHILFALERVFNDMLTRVHLGKNLHVLRLGAGLQFVGDPFKHPESHLRVRFEFIMDSAEGRVQMIKNTVVLIHSEYH